MIVDIGVWLVLVFVCVFFVRLLLNMINFHGSKYILVHYGC